MLIHHWTYDERSHVAFVRDVAAVERFVNRIESHVEIRDLWEIELVAPPPAFCARVMAHRRKVAEDEFFRRVVWELEPALKAGHALPKPFGKCRKYVPRWETPSKEDQRKHYNCKNCGGKIRLVGITREAFYDAHAARWAARPGSAPPYVPGPRVPRPVPSKARVASDTEAVWIAVDDFGHHLSGVVMAPLNQEQDAERMHHEALFYFVRIIELDVRPFTAIQEAKKKAYDDAKAARKVASDVERARVEREDIDRTLAFWGVPKAG